MKLILFCFSLLFSAFHQTKPSGFEELKVYVNDIKNGFVKEKVISGITYRALVKPSDLLIQNQITHGDINIDSLRALYDKSVFINIMISTDNLNSLYDESFQEKLQTYSFDFLKYVHIRNQNADIIKPIDYTYLRTFGLGGALQFLFAFDKSEIDEQQFDLIIKNIIEEKVIVVMTFNDLKKLNPRVSF